KHKRNEIRTRTIYPHGKESVTMRDNEYERALEGIESLCNLEILTVETGLNPQERIDDLFGAAATEASFQAILRLGLLRWARDEKLLKPGQTVIESTSGSLGVGIAAAGKLMSHPIVLVSDVNIPTITKRKIELLGAKLVLVEKPDPAG